MGTVDGLGFEEVNQTVTSTAIISGTNVYATTAVTAPNFSATGSLSSVNVVSTGSVTGGNLVTNNNLHLAAGSPYGKGIVLQMTARAIISGGMFVMGSGNLAMPAAASTKWPLGVAQPGINVASGGTVNIITHGVVPVVAESAIVIGAPAMMGAGGALNTVVAATAASGIRTFGVLSTAGSEGTVFILL